MARTAEGRGVSLWVGGGAWHVGVSLWVGGGMWHALQREGGVSRLSGLLEWLWMPMLLLNLPTYDSQQEGLPSGVNS